MPISRLCRTRLLRGSAVILLLALASCATSPSRDFRKATASAQILPPADATPLLEPLTAEPADLTEDISALLAKHRIPGAIAVVLKGNRIVAAGAAGLRKRGSPETVTLEDRFEIASSAKSISALVISRLVDRRALAWDRPVPSYFPGESLAPEWQRVTLRDLLSHTAGLRDPLLTFLLSSFSNRESLRGQRAAFARKILSRPPPRPAGETVAYTNVDYILAAFIAEEVTGETWETLVHREVFVPLSLSSAGFGPPGDQAAVSEPWGHGRRRIFHLGVPGTSTAFSPESPAADYPAMASPAGFVHLSAQDWAAYVALQLRAHKANPQREIMRWTAAIFESLHELKPRVGYAGGWFTENRPWAKGPRSGDTGRVLFHEGENGRWTSVVWLAPERDFAVLVACNQGDELRPMYELVDRLIARFAGR